MRGILTDKKYSGFIWHILFAGLFIGLSLWFLTFMDGTGWYLVSSLLRIVFGAAILAVSSRLFERKPSGIISFGNAKKALLAGGGFLLFFVYYLITVALGIGRITGLTAGLLLSRILLQQAATGFYEELNYRFLLLEGLKHTKNTVSARLLCVAASTVLFGLLHCVTGWNTYTFLQTGAIGFAFAVIFVRSGNILIPMILHFLYDVVANTAGYIEWNHMPAFDGLSSAFEIMLAVMFILSAVILLAPERKRQR